MKKFNSDSDLLIFPHSGRTGGDTFIRLLREVYGMRFQHYATAENAWKMLRRADSEALRPLKTIAGHGAYFGLHEYARRESTYLTFCRHPVNRVISQYYVYLQDSSREMHRSITENNISLLEYAHINTNEQTYYTIGYPHYFPGTPGLDNIDSILSTVQANYCFLGVTELYDESIYFAHKHLNWNEWYFWIKTLENPHRPKISEIPVEVQAEIAKLNQLDFLLYELAIKNLEQEIESLSIEERKELDFFRESQNIFKQVQQHLPEFIGYHFQRIVLQKPSLRLMILSAEPDCDSFLESFFGFLNTEAGRKIDFTIINYTEYHELMKIFVNDRESLLASDYVISLAPPAGDWQVRNEWAGIGGVDHKLIFAIDRTAL